MGASRHLIHVIWHITLSAFAQEDLMAMLKALFFNVPAHGHINPSLPLVAELTRRGHDITYFASEGFRARIEASGASFMPYANVHDDYFEARGLSGGVPQRVAYELMTTAQAILPELLEMSRRMNPDYVLFDGMCPWGYVVARALRLPAVTSLSLMPPTSPPAREMLKPHMRKFVASALFRDFSKGVAASRISQALGKQYDVVPLGPSSLLNASGDVAISYTSTYFAPHANTAPKAVRFVGWSPYEANANESYPNPNDQRRLIYISLGTVNNDNMDFFRACIEAFAGDDAVLISTGGKISPDAFGALPANIAIQSWVPQVTVLKQSALFITHGGLNSVHDGLYFGVPLLLVPQQGEQTVIAMRVAELGAGIVLDKDRVTSELLSTQAARLLAEPRYKTAAHRIGDSFRAAGGATKAADEIENVLSIKTKAA